MPDLSAMLERGPVVCAEGYLFECERRGYLQAGAFVPEVVLDHPEVVEELHREFVHAGSDVVEAFTYYGHRQKLRVIGKEDILEPLNRQALSIAAGVARETGTLLAGNLCNTNVYEPGTPAVPRGQGRVRGAGGVGRRGGRGHHHRRDVQLAGRGAAGPGGDPGRRPAGGGDLRRAPGRHAARRGQPGGGLPPGGAGRGQRGRPQLHPRAADHAAAARAGARGGVLRGGGAARALPDDRGGADDAVPARSRAGRRAGLPHRARPLHLHPRRNWASSPPPRSRSACATWASAAAPRRTTSAPWPRRRARRRRPPGTPRTCPSTRSSAPPPASPRLYQEYAAHL